MNLKLSVAALAAVFTLTAAYAQSSGSGTAPAAPGNPPAAAPGTPPGPGADEWRGGPRHHHHRHGHHHGRGAMFGHLDTDRDGAVSMAELQASQQRQTELFQRADADKDGKVTREEMRSAFAAMKGQRRGPGGPAGGPRPGAAPAAPGAPAAPAGTGTTSG